ncbi:hypothetical protein J1614_006688 [Plenodomus biglobosus]|nr:hypothetical protein J1614_006688 [Plenodomus biglobosus]
MEYQQFDATLASTELPGQFVASSSEPVPPPPPAPVKRGRGRPKGRRNNVKNVNGVVIPKKERQPPDEPYIQYTTTSEGSKKRKRRTEASSSDNAPPVKKTRKPRARLDDTGPLDQNESVDPSMFFSQHSKPPNHQAAAAPYAADSSFTTDSSFSVDSSFGAASSPPASLPPAFPPSTFLIATPSPPTSSPSKIGVDRDTTVERESSTYLGFNQPHDPYTGWICAPLSEEDAALETEYSYAFERHLRAMRLQAEACPIIVPTFSAHEPSWEEMFEVKPLAQWIAELPGTE